MRNRAWVALAVALVAIVSMLPAKAYAQIAGVLNGTQVNSSTVLLEWTVDSLGGVTGLNLMRAEDPQVNPWELINEDPLPPESPGSYEDTGVWPFAVFRYQLFAVLESGAEVEVEGANCLVSVYGSPVEENTWAAIKAMYR